MSDDGLVLFGRLCAQFGKASREGSCEYLDSDEIYLIRGDEIRVEAEEWQGRVSREDLDCIRRAAFTPEARKLEERALSAYRALEGGTDAIQRI